MKPRKHIHILLYIIAAVAILLGLLWFGLVRWYTGRSHIPSAQQSATAFPLPAHTDMPAEGLPLELVIPEGAGHVAGGYSTGDEEGRVIIHIQDIHTNYEAQKNASRILESLIDNHQLRLVMVEGGWGNVNLAYLRNYADASRREEVAEEYLRQGQISGEEYLDIVSDYDILLEGIENEQMYQANLDTFFKIEEFRAQAASELNPLLSVIDALAQRIYPQQLQKLEKTKKAYDAEQITLAEYYRDLWGAAKKTHQDFGPYTNLSSFMDVMQAEKDIQFPAVEKERSALIERLSARLGKQDLNVLVTKSLEFRLNKLSPVQYHSYLMDTAKANHEPVARYANLQRYIDYIKSHENIDTARMFEEADRLLHAVEQALLSNAQQSRLYMIARSAQVLDNFLHLKLVPADFSYYQQNRNNFLTAAWIDFLTQQAQLYKLDTANILPAETLDRNLSLLVHFYDLANERDDAFIENAMQLMDREKVNMAVLIAGGFHTPNLKQKFRENNISYIIIAPHTTQQTDPELYRYILKYKSGKE
jgi:hypothetical protein